MENLNLKNGDVITLGSGQKVTVSLTPVEVEPTINTWYICRKYNQLIYRKDDTNEGYYGFVEDKFCEKGLGCSGEKKDWDLASKREIETALKNEAIKRGFVKGVKYRRANRSPYIRQKNWEGEAVITGNPHYFDYGYGEIGLLDGGYAIFASGNWGEPIEEKKSILEGKVAVKVSNQREQGAFLSYFKIRKMCNLSTCSGYGERDIYFGNQDWSHCDKAYYERLDYKILTFDEFAKEAGIEVPKFIMKSEDGVDLYEDSTYHVVSRVRYNEKLDYLNQYTGFKNTFSPKEQKAPDWYIFYDKIKAKEFVIEQNKPKQLHYAILKHNTCTHYYLTEVFDTTDKLDKAVEILTKRDNSHVHHRVTVDI